MSVVTELDVRYPDCDTMGVVHHAVYPIWLEMGRMTFFDSCGYGYTYAHSRGTDPAMVELNVKYGTSVTFPSRVRVVTRCTLCEGKKIAFAYEVYKQGADEPCVRATSFHIWVKDGKSYNMETELPQVFGAYSAAVEKA